MDRWFVKALMDTLAFAQFSFAVSVENFLNLAITPVTTTLYNYFCRVSDEEEHRKVFNYVAVFATIIPAAAFPVKFILEVFLTKYIDSAAVVHAKEAFAVGTLLSAIVWFFISKTDFKYLRCSKKTEMYLFVQLILLLTFGFTLPSVIGCIAYMVATIASLGILMNETLRDLMGIGIKMINKRRK
jgi:hypothetical protein